MQTRKRNVKIFFKSRTENKGNKKSFRFFLHFEGFARFKRRRRVSLWQLRLLEALRLIHIYGEIVGQRSRGEGEGEACCLVFATQWGIPSKDWDLVGRSCGSGLPSHARARDKERERERERKRRGFKHNPRE